MKLVHLTYLVRDSDEAIAWFTGALGFTLLEDTDLGGGKRWVLVGPPEGTRLLLARGRRRSRRRTSAGRAGVPLPAHRRFRARSCDIHAARRALRRTAAIGALWHGCGVRGSIRQPLGSDRAGGSKRKALRALTRRAWDIRYRVRLIRLPPSRPRLLHRLPSDRRLLRTELRPQRRLPRPRSSRSARLRRAPDVRLHLRCARR